MQSHRDFNRKEIEKKVSLLDINSGKSIRTALVYDGKRSPEVKEIGSLPVEN
jgi:hypothetical protein